VKKNNGKNYPRALPLVAVERLTGISYGVLKQPKRRAALGFIDCKRPSCCRDGRTVFLTGQSVKAYRERLDTVNAMYKFTPNSANPAPPLRADRSGGRTDT
jgi:hypothetical protein